MPGGVQNVPLLFYLRRVIFLYLVIAEKPSVAHSIGEVLGATEKKSGYLAGTGCLVTWCIGHMVELAQPHVYDERYAKWKWDDLPILPEEWRYNVSLHTKKQFDTIRKLMNEPQVDTIVCATDAGREGELIFRLVYRQCGCIKPIKRLWISSLEESAIRTGFENLHDGREYESLYQAALCRQQADWLVGINASRIFSLLYNVTLNVGRVMSPTLALIVSRDAAIAAFQAEAFYTVQMSCGFLASTERLKDKAEAERIQELCNLHTAVVKNIEKKRKKNTGEAPMYYVQNNHPAIIDRVTFNKVQEELARRKTKTPGSAKSSITSTGKYSRYALTDVLICGNCGTRYRRVTWSRNGVKRIVWRCISRLDYGKKYCSDSPTIMEDKLQEAIVRAVNKFNKQDNATYKALMRATISEALGLNGDPEEVDMLERKVEALNNKMLALVNESVSSGDGIEAHESEFMTLSQEAELLKQRIAAIQESTAKDNGEQNRLEQIQAIIAERESKCMEYDDSIVRQMVECIKVYPGGKLEIIFGGGYLVEESV